MTVVTLGNVEPPTLGVVDEPSFGLPERGTELLRITLRRSLIGQKPKARERARRLGVRSIDAQVHQLSDPNVLGALRRIHHLVEVEPLPLPRYGTPELVETPAGVMKTAPYTFVGRPALAIETGVGKVTFEPEHDYLVMSWPTHLSPQGAIRQLTGFFGRFRGGSIYVGRGELGTEVQEIGSVAAALEAASDERTDLLRLESEALTFVWQKDEHDGEHDAAAPICGIVVDDLHLGELRRMVRKTARPEVGQAWHDLEPQVVAWWLEVRGSAADSVDPT